MILSDQEGVEPMYCSGFVSRFSQWQITWCIAVVMALCSVGHADNRPNIVWLSAEDISPQIGCYGDENAKTPNLDKLAEVGVRYTNAFTTAGVCAPCRSGIITGCYQTTLGTHHMRCRAKLPDHIVPFPQYLREAGYYCTNNSKEDYQFVTPPGTWDESSRKAHWRNRKDEAQPFFAVFNYNGCHESGIARDSKYREVTQVLSDDERQDAADLTLPPYYPDTPAVREDWKRNYELVTALDHWAGALIQQLKDDGLYENTIIMFWSDHGVGLPRAKRWLYDSGVHIPLIIRIPKRFRLGNQGAEGSTDSQLISSIDLAPTVLNIAGVVTPEYVQGRAFLGNNLRPPRKFVYGARDRMDERYDIIRMVRDQRWKYIRNYEPLKVYYQYMNTPEKGATMRALREGHQQGNLPPAAEQFFASSKMVEELYDITVDPNELKNLAKDAGVRGELTRLRAAHEKWVADSRDVGLIPEPILADLETYAGNRVDILLKNADRSLVERISRTARAASAGVESQTELEAAALDEHPAVRYWAVTGLGNLASTIQKGAAAPGGRAFPAHWGQPPEIQTEDFRTLPGGFGNGSSTLRRWISARMETDALQAKLLDDSSVTVQIAAARMFCRRGNPDVGLPVLVRVLKSGKQWERLHAAIVLDECDEQARPVIESMREALKPRGDLYAGGKYVVRVINRALNDLEGTERVVK